jgi:hypothetical protein
VAVDVFPLIAAERRRLAEGLASLPPDAWEAPSLCDGWTVHTVAAHLNAPWEASIPTVLIEVVMARSLGGGFDRLARKIARSLPPAACVAGLRDHADSRFTPPGSGPEAPLTDVIVHGADMLQPSGRGKAKGFMPRGRVDGLVFEASDLDFRGGPGTAVVRGPALAICTVLCGRRALLDQLSGEGLDTLAARL